MMPQHSLGFANLWLYPMLYGVVTLIVLSKISRVNKKKILTFPGTKNGRKFDSSSIGFIFGKILIIYSIAIPIGVIDAYFFIGTFIYLIGMITSVFAMWSFTKADLSKPMTKGIYKISRHPMQVMNFIMWLGIGFVSKSWIMIVCTVFYAIVSYPSLKAQERFCLEKYGGCYERYMNKTPRYLFY